MADIYEQLAHFLDELPGGFPPSESGVEVRILRRLFTPQEAAVTLHLSLLSEEAHVIAHRAGLPVEQARDLLEELDRKRLIYCFPEEGKPRTYMAQQFLVGFWESQVDRLDRELVEMFEEYLPTYAQSGNWAKMPQLRTIPVREDIPHQGTVLSYENVTEIIAEHHTFAVANCICRQEMRILGHDDGKPLETCLSFDGGADYFVRTERGRYITREESAGPGSRGGTQRVSATARKQPLGGEYLHVLRVLLRGAARGQTAAPPGRHDRQPLLCGGGRGALRRLRNVPGALPHGRDHPAHGRRPGEPGALHRLRLVRDRLPQRGAGAAAQTRRAAAACAAQHGGVKYPHGAVTRKIGAGIDDPHGRPLSGRPGHCQR